MAEENECALSICSSVCDSDECVCMCTPPVCVDLTQERKERGLNVTHRVCVCVCVPPPVTGRGWAEHRSRSTAWQSPSKREKKVLSLWWINTHTNTRTAKIQHEHKEHAHPREGYTHRRTHTVWLWPVSPRASVVNISAAYIWSMQMETLPESLAKIFMDSICCGHSQPTHRVCLCGYTPNSPSCVCACVPGVSLHVCLSVCVFAFCMLECVCVCVSCWGSVILAVGVCLSRSALLHSQQQTLPPRPPTPTPTHRHFSFPFSFHPTPFIALSIHLFLVSFLPP